MRGPVEQFDTDSSWFKYKSCIVCRFSKGEEKKEGVFHDECYEKWREASILLREKYGYWNDKRRETFLEEYPTLEDYNPMENVGYGWWGILTTLTLALEAIHPDFVVHQIKEKFGGLRYYTGGLPRVAHNLTDWAETQSELVCEYCGDHGTVSGASWLKATCKFHKRVEGKKDEVYE